VLTDVLLEHTMMKQMKTAIHAEITVFNVLMMILVHFVKLGLLVSTMTILASLNANLASTTQWTGQTLLNPTAENAARTAQNV
jgi:hypothetical protein